MESEFCVCFDGRLRDELSASAKTYLLNPVRIRKPFSVIAARRKLASILKTGDFRIVVCHSSWCQTLFGPVVRSAGIPLVFCLHDSTDGRHWLERLARRIKPCLVLSNSIFTTEAAERLYPGIPTKALYWPVTPAKAISAEERARVRSGFGVNGSDTVIIQVSRLEKWKGHLLHLEALSKLREQPNWLCWMVGGPQRPHEDEYYAAIQQKASQLGLSHRVCFLGQRSDVAPLLAAADIHCQPNLSPEPFGIAFIEALNAGLPVVTTKMGAALEIIDNSCGILVEPNDASALANALAHLIGEPGKLIAYKEHCLSRAKFLCDPKPQLARFAQILNALVAA
jgi:glycosyltransferase involved in cell wall biosynthesis